MSIGIFLFKEKKMLIVTKEEIQIWKNKNGTFGDKSPPRQGVIDDLGAFHEGKSSVSSYLSFVRCRSFRAKLK